MKELNIITARKGNAHIPAPEAIRAVQEEMAEDPVRNRGPLSVQEQLGRKGIHLPRSVKGSLLYWSEILGPCSSNYITDVMRHTDPEGFNHRNPQLKTRGPKHTGQVICIGPHDKWAGDGHEKTSSIGYPIYGLRDYWGKIHGYWVVPNARDEEIVDYLFLLAVRENGGLLSYY